MGQLPSSAFQTYDPSKTSSIQPGPFALGQYAVGQFTSASDGHGGTVVGAMTETLSGGILANADA